MLASQNRYYLDNHLKNDSDNYLGLFMPLIASLINGELLTLSALPNILVTNPANNGVTAELTCNTEAELALAVASAKTAFKSWKEVPTSQKARVMMRYQQLPKEHHNETVSTLSSE